MQMSVCNAFHSVEQRCVRWLLTVGDLTGNGEVPLTHDLMATMLGVRAGLVGERRGLITVRDRFGLEQKCCECYAVMRSEQKRLLGY